MIRKITRRLLAAITLFMPSILLLAQNPQYSYNKDKSEISVIVEPETKFTVADIIDRRVGHPLAEAKMYKLGISSDTVGVWTRLAGKNVWQLIINVPGAKGFFISFDNFYLPQGAELYVYNKENMTDAIVYRHNDNPHKGAYSIENLAGDNAILEYVSPDNKKPELLINGVGYKYSTETGYLSGFRSSLSCMVNINCVDDEQWQTIKKGVVHLRMEKSDGKTYLCSGSLVNNTANDKKPYILTANHCFENMTAAQVGANTSFFFEYESPSCANAAPPGYKFHKGSQLRVINPLGMGGDVALLELSEAIPGDWDVYFNGWDRENTAANIKNGKVIHHPRGDVKKISSYASSPAHGKWEDIGTNNNYWVVGYSDVGTQGGSSGAPMLNNNGLIVGTLSGGDAFDCSASDRYRTDVYGKFWYNWNQYIGANVFQGIDTKLATYLDPEGQDVKALSGLYNIENVENELVLDKADVSLLINTSAKVKILSGNGNYTVTSADNTIASATVTDDEIEIISYKRGNTTIKVTDKRGKEKEIQATVYKNIEIASKDASIIINVYGDDIVPQIRLINLDADVLYDRKNVKDFPHTIDMSPFNKGVYVIQIKTQNKGTQTEKILWQK
ncbi:trypsin-like peptidase domain-containing protein [Dysgonomonas sp. 511]|uniref:trypsin-like peptidase domain-containing protein n=1 Tax=Dysgonomonas sp. 511 TaxID=2302930 RepID=UPI0013D54C83|nr:trypsin-like peptidase domain-containing protein [Dysgonomonas sp. 511]NDV79386.1 serine protease [Dysgonomonas sp. 511]